MGKVKHRTNRERVILENYARLYDKHKEERIFKNGVDLKKKLDNGRKRYNGLGSRVNTGLNRVTRFKAVEFPKELPDWWDMRSYRQQIYAWIDSIGEQYGVSALVIFRNCGYDLDKHRQFLNGMKNDDKRYVEISLGQIQKIARLTNTPFVLM